MASKEFIIKHPPNLHKYTITGLTIDPTTTSSSSSRKFTGYLNYLKTVSIPPPDKRSKLREENEQLYIDMKKQKEREEAAAFETVIPTPVAAIPFSAAAAIPFSSSSSSPGIAPPLSPAAAPPISPDAATAMGKELLAAIDAKNVPECLRLVGARADLTVKDEYGNTALALACDKKLSEVALAILNVPGVMIDAKDSNGITPLIFASKQNIISVVAALLGKGADINAVTNRGSTALYLACSHSHAATALHLIDNGADVNAGSVKPLSAPAVDTAPMAAVKAALLARGAITDEAATDLGEELLAAIRVKNVTECLRLVGARADLAVKDEIGNAALALACGYELSEVALAILAVSGVEIDARNNNGQTPLMFASAHGLTPVVTALLGKGADINAADNDGCTALYFTCGFSQAATALQLIEAGADVNAGTQKPLSASAFDTPPMAAVKAALLARGAAVPAAAAAAVGGGILKRKRYTRKRKLFRKKSRKYRR